MNRLALSFLALAAVGCGAGSDPNAKPLHDVEAATRALDRAVGIETAFVTPGNVDTGATPAIIASALVNRVQSEGAGCVTASASDNSVHADFGATCALATASMHAGGTVDAVVAADMATGGIVITFTLAVTVDGEPLAGALSTTTSNGNDFTFASDGLTLDGTTVTAPLLTAGIAAGGATLSGDHATAGSGALVLEAVHQRFAGCYPDEGTTTLDALGVTFASDTPQTGNVALSTGKSATLPRRSGCPN